MINKVDFKAKNLTSNAGLFLLFESAKNNGIFELIENDYYSCREYLKNEVTVPV